MDGHVRIVWILFKLKKFLINQINLSSAALTDAQRTGMKSSVFLIGGIHRLIRLPHPSPLLEHHSR
jgi:hypothetical protein